MTLVLNRQLPSSGSKVVPAKAGTNCRTSSRMGDVRSSAPQPLTSPFGTTSGKGAPSLILASPYAGSPPSGSRAATLTEPLRHSRRITPRSFLVIKGWSYTERGVAPLVSQSLLRMRLDDASGLPAHIWGDEESFRGGWGHKKPDALKARPVNAFNDCLSDT